MGGTYPDQIIKSQPQLTPDTTPVTITAAPGADPQLNGLDVRASSLTIRHLTFISGPLFVRQQAKNVVVSNITFTRNSPGQRSVVLGGDGGQLLDSTFAGNVDQDFVLIGVGGSSVKDVVVRGNTFKNAVVGPHNGHVDCIQMASEATNVLITDNYMEHCANSALIVKPDLGPITGVTITNNVLIGCVPRTAKCNGFYAVYLRSSRWPISDIRFLHNSVLGVMSIDRDIAGLQISANVMTSITYCGPWESNNVFLETPRCTSMGAGDVVVQPSVTSNGANWMQIFEGVRVRVPKLVGPTSDIRGVKRPDNPYAGAFEWQS